MVIFSALRTAVPWPVVTPRLTSRIVIRLSPIEPTLLVKVVSRTGRLWRKAGVSRKEIRLRRRR
jgi:hypothetical protein